MDYLQDLEARESEARQAAARMPDVPVPVGRDCDDCGEPIPSARLVAVPMALRCVTCEEIHGQRVRFNGRPSV